jgi:hypothetical protein
VEEEAAELVTNIIKMNPKLLAIHMAVDMVELDIKL